MIVRSRDHVAVNSSNMNQASVSVIWYRYIAAYNCVGSISFCKLSDLNRWGGGMPARAQVGKEFDLGVHRFSLTS